MPHSAVIALPAFSFAMILGLRVADTTTLNSDLYVAQLCVGYTSLIFDTIKRNTDRQIGIEKNTQDFSSCLAYEELYCGAFGDNFVAEAETEIVKSINFGLRNVGRLSECEPGKKRLYLFRKSAPRPEADSRGVRQYRTELRTLGIA
jgi:hypothetical protein